MHPVRRWHWIDADQDPEQARRLRVEGPFEGTCPACGADAVGRAPFVELSPTQEEAVLWLPADRRGEVLEALARHVDRLREHPEWVQPWMLRPRPAVLEPEEVTGRYELPARMRPMTGDTGVPRPIGVGASARVRTPTGAIGSVVGTLVAEGDVVRVEAEVSPEVAERWEGAELEVRPVHLPDLGYPLVGVRVIGARDGQRGVVDAFLDVGRGECGEVFRILSEKFEVHVYIYSLSGTGSERPVSAEGLERNAALCLESARGALAGDDYPPEAYEAALEKLASIPVDERLATREPSLAVGAYRHLVGVRETQAALDLLDEVSKRENLSRVLEVEGLPFPEFDEIRRRVLQASMDVGLCAPRRFWRRIVASGMAKSLGAYARTLAENRQAMVADDDLTEELRVMAWQGIWELCDRKNITPPPALREALGLPEPVEQLESIEVEEYQEERTTAAAAGEIGGVNPDTSVRVQRRLADPKERLQAATELLTGKVDDRSLAMVLDALEALETDELLAVLPELSGLGGRAVPGLVAKLRSDRREVRQAAVILLGMAAAAEVIDPLIHHLVREPTTVWVDVARALGAQGTNALDALADHLVDSGEDGEVLGRVSRAMAEVAVAGTAGRKRVESMADNEMQPLVATAARRALATLGDVTESGAQIRGEIPLPEVTEVRGFARRAYEAITIPEVEILDEVELES